LVTEIYNPGGGPRVFFRLVSDAEAQLPIMQRIRDFAPNDELLIETAVPNMISSKLDGRETNMNVIRATEQLPWIDYTRIDEAFYTVNPKVDVDDLWDYYGDLTIPFSEMGIDLELDEDEKNLTFLEPMQELIRDMTNRRVTLIQKLREEILELRRSNQSLRQQLTDTTRDLVRLQDTSSYPPTREVSRASSPLRDAMGRNRSPNG